MIHLIPWADVDSANWSDYVKVDDLSGSLTGAYAEATADGDRFTWPVRLGPEGSVWGLFTIAHRNTDGGKIDYQFATADDDEYGLGRFTLDADATFVTLQTRDLYNASPTKNEDFTEHAFRINGTEGDALTSITGADPDVPAAYVFDGGPGLYLFRVHTNGQNGSSSGYRSQLVSLLLRREPG